MNNFHCKIFSPCNEARSKPRSLGQAAQMEPARKLVVQVLWSLFHRSHSSPQLTELHLQVLNLKCVEGSEASAGLCDAGTLDLLSNPALAMTQDQSVVPLLLESIWVFPPAVWCRYSHSRRTVSRQPACHVSPSADTASSSLSVILGFRKSSRVCVSLQEQVCWCLSSCIVGGNAIPQQDV